MPHIEHCPFFPLICHFYCIPKIGTLEVRFLNFWTSENRNVTILISTILSIVILNQSYQSYPKSFPCIMEMCITGYGVMDNLSSQHMEKQSAAFPHPANRVIHNSIYSQLYDISTMSATAESHSFLSISHKKIFSTPMNRLQNF